jgi:hypothetical protein
MTEKNRNDRPHLLIATVQTYGPSDRYKGVGWAVQCPYGPDDIRDCGMIEECTGSEEDAAKWGCTPRPVEPQGMPEDTEDNRSAWEKYLAAEDEWTDDHVHYAVGYGHRIGKCWFSYILGQGEVEPEDILENIPEGPIDGPIKVEVHYDGGLDEAYPSFTLWKEAADGDQS